MSKLENCIAQQVYTLKRNHPAIREVGRRVKEVERELNKGNEKDGLFCECKRKPMCKSVCKNRQKY